jgi:mono/diheme cytochrome c family protein
VSETGAPAAAGGRPDVRRRDRRLGARRLAASVLGALVVAGTLAAQETAPAPAGKSAKTDLYTVVDGSKVDPQTLNGWKTWRALACDRCHGASQEGMVGPSLVQSLKVLSKEQFHATVMNGRLEKGMPSFSASEMMQANWEGLYGYLKGRSDGNIAPGHLYPIDGYPAGK